MQIVGAQEISVLKEMNGELVGFGERLVNYWIEQEPRLKEQFTNSLDKVVYTDRTCKARQAC